eukprot:gb/GECH01012519.1/.p1 GENE.gb/GECH01012519.1/~~gb/GECH01012519.1/.p1  ORF type:complete len:335 (+),score=73.45 gb/GECH01012519.1/:1-1005(+)
MNQNHHSDNIIVYATQNSSYFADLIAKELNAQRGDIIRKKFGDGEEYYRINIEDRSSLVGKDVVFVGSTHCDSDLLELFRVGTALAQYGTRKRIFAIPFLGYSTMERAVKAGEIVSTKANAVLLSSIPHTGFGNTFLFLDLHKSGILHYFEGPCDRLELYAEEPLTQALQQADIPFKEGRAMFGSADLGRPLWVQTFATKFETDIAFVRKTRDSENVKVVDVIGDVTDQHVVIYDDMTRSANTLINAAYAYFDHGAESVTAVLSHLAFNDDSTIKRLLHSPIDTIIGTNSHPMSQSLLIKQNPDQFTIVDVSPVFARAICGCLGLSENEKTNNQ